MPDKWFIIRKRYIPAVWTVHTFWTWEVAEYFKVPTAGIVLNVWDKGDYWAVYEDKETRLELGQAVANKILNEVSDLKEFRQKGIRAGEEVVQFTRKFAEHSAQASLKEAIDFLQELTREYSKIMKYNMQYWIVGTPFIQERAKDTLKQYKEKETEEIIHTMSESPEPSYSKKIEVELSKLELDPKAIKEFSESYFWFPYEYVGPGVWDEKTVTDLVQKRITSGEILHIKGPEEVQNNQKNCIEKYKLSPQTIRFFEIIQTLGLMQDDRKRYNSEICYYVNGVIFTNLAKRMGIKREEALYLDEELIELYEKDRETFLKRLALRNDMLVEVTEKGASVFYEGRENSGKILKELDLNLSENIDVKEIKGQIAFRGKVTGRARILKTSQVSDFKDGEIIVTGMTTPDFALLIRKAAAIVTNEGGITCHAAIIARELKKPCIIGTKIATQVLKDGDMIEVDAEKGIVRIIEK